jgi:hypothetical protein
MPRHKLHGTGHARIPLGVVLAVSFPPSYILGILRADSLGGREKSLAAADVEAAAAVPLVATPAAKEDK